MSFTLSPEGVKALPRSISFFAKSNDAGIILVFNSFAILKNPVFHSFTFERVPSGDIPIKELFMSLI